MLTTIEVEILKRFGDFTKSIKRRLVVKQGLKPSRLLSKGGVGAAGFLGAFCCVSPFLWPLCLFGLLAQPRPGWLWPACFASFSALGLRPFFFCTPFGSGYLCFPPPVPLALAPIRVAAFLPCRGSLGPVLVCLGVLCFLRFFCLFLSFLPRCRALLLVSLRSLLLAPSLAPALTLFTAAPPLGGWGAWGKLQGT